LENEDKKIRSRQKPADWTLNPAPLDHSANPDITRLFKAAYLRGYPGASPEDGLGYPLVHGPGGQDRPIGDVRSGAQWTTRRCCPTTAIGSSSRTFPVNGGKYPKGFIVKAQSGEPLWSGCSGVDLERWTSAFLSQKGLDMENWPEAFRKRFGEMPKGIRFL
jgi:hypothetical protein